MENLGILVIDMQEDFIGRNKPREIEELIQYQKKLFKFAHKKKIPIFILEWENCGKTSEELISELSNNKTYFIPKYENNGFLNEDLVWEEDSFKEEYQNKELSNLLEKEQIKNLILTGISKDACVLATTLGAKRRGYNPFTSDELMNKRKKDVYEFHEYSNHYETLQELLEAIC
ncbi:cysteine hydrolase [Candidatus Pacearchaeota archaeon]|jgi:nicotinamidase-related amidase|nr:cysteine hydrolase [Candidatus Pacearchaeota archaeon]